MTNFALQLKEKKFWKKTKMHLPIIWIERISLLQVYFRHFIAKQRTIFKDVCCKQGAQFCFVLPPVVWFTVDLQTGHLEDRDHVLIILQLLFAMKFFRIFFRIIFPKKYIFLCSGLRKPRCIYWKMFCYMWCSLVKICKKYIEVNHVLLLSLRPWKITVGLVHYSTRRQCIVFLNSLVVHFGGNLLELGQLFSEEILWWAGEILRGDNFPLGQSSWGNYPGGNHPGENYPEENFPRGQMPGLQFLKMLIFHITKLRKF